MPAGLSVRKLKGWRQVWDLRKLKGALAAYGGLDNFFDTTAAVFGPGDEYFMTGTSVRRAKDGSAQVAKRSLGTIGRILLVLFGV